MSPESASWGGRIPLSPSIRELVATYDEEVVDAAELVRHLGVLHPEYGRHMGGKLGDVLEPTSDSRPVAEWISRVEALTTPAVRQLHGRLMILGLARIDSGLDQQLRSIGFLDLLEEELQEPIDAVLGPIPTTGAEPGTDVVFDSVRFHTDTPAVEDELARGPFARYLAAKLRYLRLELDKQSPDSSFLVHLDGPWGAGKTSVLNFVAEALREEVPPEEGPSPWIIVTFNAWRHQRLHPPWWSLMASVFQQSTLQLRSHNRWRSAWFWLRHRVWRAWVGGAPLVVALAVLAVLIWVMFGALPDFEVLGISSESLRNVGLLSTLAGTAYVISRHLLPASQHAARTFIQASRDPMDAIKDQFTKMVRRVGLPVAVFVDDLDRCEHAYVVELLEGIQTLFRDAGVAYVVASDRRWIEASYEEVYEALTGTIREPGRTLGNLFLDKTFQLSAGLPPLPLDVTGEFWRSLVGIVKDDTDDGRGSDASTTAKHEFKSLRTPQDVQDRLTAVAQDPVVYRGYAQAALERLAAPDMQQHTESALSEFLPLLEPNPRAMKRLVNAYDVQRAIFLLAGGSRATLLRHLDKQLALWTIVLLRWPSLGEALQVNPALVSSILEGVEDDDLASMDQRLQELLRDSEVRRVVAGDEVGVALDERAIQLLTGSRVGDEQRPTVA